MLMAASISSRTARARTYACAPARVQACTDVHATMRAIREETARARARYPSVREEQYRNVAVIMVTPAYRAYRKCAVIDNAG